MWDRWSSPLLTIGLIVVFLAAAGLLPPDTSLAQIQKTGILRVCLPDSYPPLVIANGEQRGIDVDILTEVASRLGLRLSLNRNSSIGRDINPRNWRLNRAQCQIIAGGVVASLATRSYLDTTPPHLAVGWAIIVAQPVAGLRDAKVGFNAGLSGFDRVALGRFLRSAGAQVVVARSSADLVAGLKAGDYPLAVTESNAAREIARDNGWTVEWLSDSFAPSQLALGLWKGDLTFKRAIDAAMAAMERDGTLAAIIDRYDLEPIEGTFDHSTVPPPG